MDVKEIIKEVFPDWSENKRNMIQISPSALDSNNTIALLPYGDQLYFGMAKRHPNDPENEEIGARVALEGLKKRIRASRKSFEKHVWIPKKDTYYFTIVGWIQETDDEYIPVPDVHIVRWHGAPLDYYRLGAGIVFKTERDARKYARTLEIRGREVKNVYNKLP